MLDLVRHPQWTIDARGRHVTCPSRYGGIHFRDGDLVGRALGRMVGLRAWLAASALIERAGKDRRSRWLSRKSLELELITDVAADPILNGHGAYLQVVAAFL
jgi:hypothetical protein